MQPMALSHALLAGAAVLGALTTYLYVATAIAYRHRDNGLAYILFVLGVGIWNGLFAAQFLTQNPLVDQFFLSLSMVGGLLAGLGWFLFAASASSTQRLPGARTWYAAGAVAVGIAITTTVTAPVHSFYWVLDLSAPSQLLEINPMVGYWLHTALFVGLIGGGTSLFADAWRRGVSVPYTRAYTVAGLVTSLAIIGSNLLAPGGLSVAPLAGVGLATIGWLQAKRWSGWRSIWQRRLVIQ
ncbi:MAG: histidine kinase N-terminal 7TM domain-containing protein [Halobacteriaceae archaeon]